jgi:hypothetical protein
MRRFLRWRASPVADRRIARRNIVNNARPNQAKPPPRPIGRRPITPAGNQRGGVAVTVALALAGVIGMASLGIEVTYVLLMQRQMQAAADAAALAAAAALANGHASGMIVEADGVASASGFTPGLGGVSLVVNNPPQSGVHTGAAGAVEVFLSQPQSLWLGRIFGTGQFNVKVRAVGLIGSAGLYCALQLNSAAPVGVTINNGASANLSKCGLAVDSTSATALSMSGGANLTTTSAHVAGGATINNGAAINPATALKTAQANVADPYAAVAAPSFSGCGGGTGKTYGLGTWTVSPGVYCNGLAFNNGASVTMNPGVYIIDRGTFDVEGGAHLTGTGVTIYLTSSTGSGYATVVIGNGATVVLSASTTGATAGMLFFADRRSPATNQNTMTGGVAINVTGALYFPSDSLTFENGTSNPSGCTQLIAGKLQLTGGSSYQNNCPASVKAIGASSSNLVE